VATASATPGAAIVIYGYQDEYNNQFWGFIGE